VLGIAIVPLLPLLLTVASPTAQTAQAAAAGVTLADATVPVAVHLTVADGVWLHPDQSFDLEISRPLVTSETGAERLAILIGDEDWTAFFTLTGLRCRLDRTRVPSRLRLPSGDVSVHVYLTTVANQWQPLTDFTLHVTTPAGFERARVTPRVDINSKGQVAESHSPASAAPSRTTFQDVTANVGLRTEHVRDGMTMTTQVDFVGASHQPEALRFGTEGIAAPQFDLADYAVGVEGARGKVAIGQLAFSPERHLIASFASRGLSLTARLPRADLTIAAINGNNIVGFDNLFGLSTPANRLALAVLGVELASHPGLARIEASFVDGSRLPKPGFTQTLVNDAEKSRGEALRFVGHDAGQRVRFDAGVARSRFTNPADPLLAQGQAIVAVREQTNDAEYVDSSFDLVKGARLGRSPGTLVRLTAGYHFERIEPLFRSVGTVQGSRADVLQHVAEINGSLGALTAQASQTWSHDNLGHIASLLRTDTELTSATVALPIGALRGTRARADWLPTLSYSFNRSSQVGEGTPIDGGFASPSQIPNQVATIQSARADWNFPRWRIGYSVNRSFQDNRQPERETADFENLVQGVTIGITRRKVDLSTDLGLERATNREQGRVGRTRRIGATGTWRITTRSTLNAIVSRSLLNDAAASLSAAADVNLQFTQTLPPQHRAAKHATFQLFGRWSRQSADVITFLLNDDQRRRTMSVSTGLSLSVF
jgi:hypothetical protein